MKLSKILKFANFFHKEAVGVYKRRRVVPRWQESTQEEVSQVPEPEIEQGFLGDFGEPEKTQRSQLTDWISSNVSQEVPVETTETGEITQPEQVYTGVGSPAKKPKREKAKTKEQLEDEYWSELKGPGTGYKPSFLGDTPDAEDIKGPKAPSKKRIKEKEEGIKGDIYSKFERAQLERAEKEKEEKKRRSRQEESESEEEKFQQAGERLGDIEAKLEEKMNTAKEELILPKIFGTGAPLVRGKGKQPNETAPSELISAFKQVKAGGGDAKMIKVLFPKTPYTDPFLGWVLAPADADSGKIREILADIHKLEANRKNIELSQMSREERMREKSKPSFNIDEFFSDIKRRPVSTPKKKEEKTVTPGARRQRILKEKARRVVR